MDAAGVPSWDPCAFEPSGLSCPYDPLVDIHFNLHVDTSHIVVYRRKEGLFLTTVSCGFPPPHLPKWCSSTY